MFQTGQEIGPYSLIKRIGRGGFGEVWLAERRAKFVTTKVAIKMPLDKMVDPEMIKQEAVLWEQASGHPNVLPIIDADEYDGQIVIVSEYAPDGSLDELLEKEKTLSIRKSVEMTIDILKGLDFLHSRKIIHRDIKPANVLLQGDTPRLTDFGVSRVIKATSISLNISGTPSYMAPEAFDRKRTVQTDIWSVGVVLYRMLIGYLPFPEGSVTDLISSVVKDEPQPFQDFVPSELRRIILKALAKRSTERFQTARAMSNDLTNYLISISKGDVEITKKDYALLKTLPMEDLSETKDFPITDAPASGKSTAERDISHAQMTEHATASSGEISPKPRLSARRIGLFGLLAILLTGSAYGGYILYQRYNSSQLEPVATQGVRLIPFRKGDKWGFCDENKKLIIEAKYDGASPFSEGLAIVNIGRKDQPGTDNSAFGKTGAIDITGKEVIPLKYDAISTFKNGLAIMTVGDPKFGNGKFGLIDNTGREIVPAQYDEIGKFVDGLAFVVLNKKLGYIDEKGAIAIPLIYGAPKLRDVDFFADASQDNRNFSGGVAAVNKGRLEYQSDFLDRFGSQIAVRGKFGYINMVGEEVIPFKYGDAGRFSSDIRSLAAVYTDYRCGYIDLKGKMIILAKWIYCNSFSEYLASVMDNDSGGKWGFIDVRGNVVIPLKYDSSGAFHEGLAAAAVGEALGFINTVGEEVIQPKYYPNYPKPKFDKGLARVCLSTGEFRTDYPKFPKLKCGYIDKNGNEVIPLKYDDSYSEFIGDLVLVKLDEKEFYIDRNGVEYYEP